MGRDRDRRVQNTAAVRAAQQEARNRRRPWYRSGPGWRTFGTAMGVIAAVLTLSFTGVTTIFQACVASDQLRQSKEDARRAERAQASRITFWTDRADAGERLHVKNGSVDPVSDLTLAFRIHEVTVGGIRGSRGLYVETFPGLAPCSELMIENGMLALEGKPVPPHMELRVAGLAFTDSNGKEWLRTAGALKMSRTAVIEWEGDVFHQLHEEPVRPTRPPVVKSVSPCS
ncbi:hypothetical protein ACFVIB_01590 [Streptomyces nigra]|uniref:hypothetical protein n=1 Tax=Streptomyces nigra TaxID=1827580 RepID=UPI0036387241